MKTKKVIFIRHGDYIPVEPFNLSDEGKSSIRRLALKLIPEIRDKEVVFLTSIANRAIQTSEQMEDVWLKNDIEVYFHKHYEIWSGNDAHKEARRLKEQENKEVSVYNQRWLHEFIQSCNKEVIVIISHLEIVESSPILLGFSPQEVSKGRARVLNLNSKEETII